MIFNLSHPPVRNADAKDARRHPGARAAVAQLAHTDQQLAHVRRVAATCMRGAIVLLGVLALRWGPFVHPSDPTTLLAALALACVAIVLGYTGWLTGWPALAADATIVSMLLYATGRAGSPLLGLTMVLILQGMLLGESAGALAGTSAAIAMLLIQNIGYFHPFNAIVADLAVVNLLAGIMVAWLWHSMMGVLRAARAPGAQERETGAIERAHQIMHWQRVNLQLATCATIDQLLRQAASHAQSIAGAPATIALDEGLPAEDSQPDPTGTSVPIACGEARGRISIQRPAGELGMIERDALDQLATLLGLRLARLRSAAAQERQRAALAALWEISGLMRAAPGDLEIVREALARMAAALDLNWLALLGPDDRHTLASIAIARTRRGAQTPLMTGAQVRVAFEALRGERPLVRAEGADALVCLPIGRSGHTPLVLAAHGGAGDAEIQALLMVFGEMLADRLAAA